MYVSDKKRASLPQYHCFRNKYQKATSRTTTTAGRINLHLPPYANEGDNKCWSNSRRAGRHLFGFVSQGSHLLRKRYHARPSREGFRKGFFVPKNITLRANCRKKSGAARTFLLSPVPGTTNGSAGSSSIPPVRGALCLSPISLTDPPPVRDSKRLLKLERVLFSGLQYRHSRRQPLGGVGKHVGCQRAVLLLSTESAAGFSCLYLQMERQDGRT